MIRAIKPMQMVLQINKYELGDLARVLANNGYGVQILPNDDACKGTVGVRILEVEHGESDDKDN